jgi:siderophore synthetase component
VNLDDVERWALGEGVSATTIRRLHDEALLVAISRLLQAIYREQYGGPSILEHGYDGSTWLVIGQEPSLRLPVGDPLPFQRLEATGLPQLVEGGRRRTVRTAPTFLQGLRLAWQRAGRIPFDRLAADFSNSLANLLLDRVLFHRLPRNTSVIEPSFEGHNCHPFPALRLGPTLMDVVSCSNLSSRPVELPLATIGSRRFVSVEHQDDEAFSRQWMGCTTYSPPGPIPLHPWQLSLSSVIRSCRVLGVLEILPHRVRAMPLASQRTCRILATGYDVKLPVDATLTSERRLLYPFNTVNAPVTSALVKALRHGHGPDTLDFQYDVASIAHPDERIGCHLAAIVRAPPPRHATDIIVPALLLWTGPRLARSLLRIGDREQARELFLAYCQILLRGPVEFYTRWGLAFEPHLQNALIRIRDGWPTGLVLRDLDATILDRIRVSRLLRTHGMRLPAEPWEAMPPFAHGGQRLAHALLFAHLSQVMVFLMNHVGIEIAALSSCVEQVWGRLLRSHSGASRDRVEELGAQSFSVKRLLAMRMQRSTDLSFARPPVPSSSDLRTEVQGRSHRRGQSDVS